MDQQMSLHAIISYDDTLNDHDGLMFGRVLGELGTKLTLAYVRHSTRERPEHEQVEGHAAEALLERGATWLEDPNVDRRVVVSASTGDGLNWLAQQEHADIVVFGSDYRTSTGHISIGRSAQRLLERGPAAVALAPAGYQSRQADINTIGVLPGSADESAIETAFSLAGRLEATVVDRADNVDLLIVGSRSESPEGRVTLSSRSQNAIEEAMSPVLVVARGVALHFETLVTA
ncbi:MAG TPA: universal stress protein [Solirubrobacteraceae bacterium]|jgi:nucleotide-binding universal stress UspA family protein